MCYHPFVLSMNLTSGQFLHIATFWWSAFHSLSSFWLSFQVSYSTSTSMQWEFEKSPASVVYLFSITYAIAITFSIFSCWRFVKHPQIQKCYAMDFGCTALSDRWFSFRLDNVRTKVWVAAWGVLSTGLAVLSGFGVLLLLNQPFVMTVASCPFMILGKSCPTSRSMRSPCIQKVHETFTLLTKQVE